MEGVFYHGFNYRIFHHNALMQIAKFAGPPKKGKNGKKGKIGKKNIIIFIQKCSI